ncbi:hypothetical protein AX16_002338 [Volvariella volvacea WC 439]|nr:hypothetical protein AX16_002338 [Volvariella volvacea WC 439]
MRVLTWFGVLFSTAAFARAVELAVEDEAIIENVTHSDEPAGEPEIVATASFPEHNAFGRRRILAFSSSSVLTTLVDIINGEQNSLTLTVENKSKQNVTLLGVAGQLLNPTTDALIKNTHQTGDNVKYTVTAYDSIVTIVEPPISIFDLKLISTYLIVFSFLGGLGYVAYLSFVPSTKKTRIGKKTGPTTEIVNAPTATSTGTATYDEEWIPEHHLRKTKGGKKQKQNGATSATSADELSGAETSGTEGKRRKGKK